MLWLRRLIYALAIIVALLLTFWTSAALLFDSPFPALRAPAAVAYLIVVLAAMLIFRRRHLGVLIAYAGFVLVVCGGSR